MNGSELNLLTLAMQNIRTCLASLLDPTDALELINPSGGTSQGCLHQVHFITEMQFYTTEYYVAK